MSNSVFGFKKAEDSPGFLLWQTTTIWQRLIKKALESHGISHAQFVVLAILLWFEEHNNETTQVLIAKWSKLDKMTVSKSLKKLATQGYVTRSEHKTDTRAKQIRLTAVGKNFASKLVPLIEKIDQQFFGVIEAHDQKTLIQILNQIMLKTKE